MSSCLRNIPITAAFRPAECLIGPVLFLARTLLSGAEGLGGQLGSSGHMVPTPVKKHSTSSMCRFSREQRRALKKLAGAPRGLTEHLLLAYGFSVEMLSGLVLAELATVVTEPMRARRGLTIMVERIRITDDGRRVLEG